MIAMNQGGYLKLLIETIPGYRGYESVEGKTVTDILVRERCTVNMNTIMVNLEHCRGKMISTMGADPSEMKIISSLIRLAKEPLLLITSHEMLGAQGSSSANQEKERLYALDRNILELGLQLEKLSEDMLSSLMAADDLDLAEREIFLQRGLNHLRELWRERFTILKRLTY